MPICSYCDKPAGFFKWWHGTCRNEHRDALQSIRCAILIITTGRTTAEGAARLVQQDAARGRVNPQDVQKAVLRGWQDAIERAFSDHLLTQDEQNALEQIAEQFQLPARQTESGRERIREGEVLREITEGRIPEFRPTEPLPFNFQKSEKLVWVFTDVDYHKQKTTRRFEGGSRGMSVRVAKGVYVRAGAFKGRSISETEDQYIDTGTLAFTTKHLYFSSDSKRFRIRWDKIMAFDPMEDGIGIQRDRSNAKPESFINYQGWFTHNLAANLARV